MGLISLSACPGDLFCNSCHPSENDNICQSCQYSYLDKTKNKCFQIHGNIENCLELNKHDSFISCLTCEMGFYDKDDKCLACPSNCFTCHENLCFSCKDGKLPKDGSCYKALERETCSTQNCQVCDKDNVCLKCEKGFSKPMGRNACVKGIDNCLWFDEKLDVCRVCDEGYYINDKYGCSWIVDTYRKSSIVSKVFFVIFFVIFIGALYYIVSNRKQSYRQVPQTENGDVYESV